MTLVIKAQEVSFSTIDNIHSTPTNGKSQVVLELVKSNHSLDFMETHVWTDLFQPNCASNNVKRRDME